jgi:predicted transposase YdaD
VLKLLSAVTGDNSYELINKNSERKVTNMCEVAERLKNSGRAEGEFIGKIKFALKLNWNIPDIAKEVGLSVGEVQEIIDREHLA